MARAVPRLRGNAMSESLYQQTARGLREGAAMARANAAAARADGDEKAAIESERHAALWDEWAERELLLERMFREDEDDRSDVAA